MGKLLAQLAQACARRPRATLLAALLLAALSLTAAATRLGVTTDTGKLFDASLPWKRDADALAALFPQNDKLIVAVIDAPAPETEAAIAAAFAARLTADPAHFRSIRRPDAEPYFRANAFLLLEPKPLQSLLDRLIDAQPFLGALNADPSLGGLCAALGLVTQGVAHGQSIAALAPNLARFHAALAASLAPDPAPLSWQSLLAGDLAARAGRFRFVLIKPVLDYTALEPGGAATRAARAIAASLPETRAGQAHIRFTGQVVLDDEEFATVAEGAVWGLLISFALVLLWLYLALGRWRLILPVVATLLWGLLVTTGFAALAIGTLNLISVAFAVLFVGIAVDFAIQFTVRLREQLGHSAGLPAALAATGGAAGPQILIASLATALGFLAFVPTDFRGVAQLGLIAGFGMLIAFAATLTLLPALLVLCAGANAGAAAQAEAGFSWGARADQLLARHARLVLAGFAALALAGAAILPAIPFDGDPLHTKDPNSEGVATLADLAADPFTNPSNIQALLPSLPAAQAAASAYAGLAQTHTVLTAASFVPASQPAKLAAIADASEILATTLASPAAPPAATPARLRAASMQLAASINALTPALPPTHPLVQIGADAAKLAAADDATLLRASDALTRYLPEQLATLRAALAAKPVTLADLPPSLRADWLLADGRARVQALPRPGLSPDAMAAWVAAATNAVPQSSGSAVYIARSTAIVTSAFTHAALGALAAIGLILALFLRRALDVALVMAPLLAGSLLTALALHVSGGQLNFANVIALPLLLGVGVSFNIYFVMNWRAGVQGFLRTPTARAVVFSALTTGTAFGSLAASHHPGTASMGQLLLLSLACTMLASLIFVPALLSRLVPSTKVAP